MKEGGGAQLAGKKQGSPLVLIRRGSKPSSASPGKEKEEEPFWGEKEKKGRG